MKVLHLMLACFYIDNYSYQENYLPKYHKQQGHEVEIVASLFTFDENGKGNWLSKPSSYINEYGIPVTRLAYKKGRVSHRLKRYEGLREELERCAPECIFIHGVQSASAAEVIRYCKRHPGTRVYVDNHADSVNSAKGWVSKNILHRVVWRHYAQKLEPYVTKFYGVLPARVDFLINMYGLPKHKVELLVMGADDDSVQAASQPEVRARLRRQYGLGEDDFAVITGGKIDHNKPQVLTLMQAVNELEDPHIKLLVFGSVHPDLEAQFNRQLSERVRYIGWKQSADIYNEFAVADLIAFPGLHSVLWEQAVAMGKPCAFRRLAGFDHIDLGGNCVYFEEDTPASYADTVLQAKEQCAALQTVAVEHGISTFSYAQIAKRSLEG
ncbi:MAG: glycosyltransferase family 4 protein [Clostridia bacterium]|nr:glycosyltransferase family 4 protein [Clostridia bacterium]MBQ9861181.1 glycosyltransferase family 4 protein [Clostridia bacterium]